jgi:hypothetical protein
LISFGNGGDLGTRGIWSLSQFGVACITGEQSTSETSLKEASSNGRGNGDHQKPSKGSHSSY